MNDLSRRQFMSGVAKSCLGVSAILTAQDLIGDTLPKHVPSARHVIFLAQKFTVLFPILINCDTGPLLTNENCKR